MFTHHLKQPPQQEAHTNLRRAREVELVAQGGSKDKVVHVWREGEELSLTVAQHMRQKEDR